MSLSTGGITQRVPEVEVLAVPEPQFTKTWHPISHNRLIQALDSSIKKASVLVLNREYSLNAIGTKMFGVWQLSGSRSGQQDWAIGIRNSIDKSMTVGLVAGIHVFVCDNRVFSGEVVLLRRHTSGLNDSTLQELCQAAMGKTITQLSKFENWFEALNEIMLPNPTVSKLLTFEAIKAGILPGSSFVQMYRMFFQPGGRYYTTSQTLGNWHNAITHTMHKDSLFNVHRKNQKLSKLIDHWYGNQLPNTN